jgi:NAD(P) transhydrogenase subunit alpha
VVPGKKAPLLVTEAMVRDMKPGSVIVDLAAEMGGNCELTKPGQRVTAHGVLILGPLNIPASLPVHASQMYSRNISALLLHLVKDGALRLDWEDEITREACAVREGRVVYGTTREPSVPPAPAQTRPPGSETSP